MRFKRGISGIVTTILIILLVLALVVIVWQVIIPNFRELVRQIGFDSVTTNLEINKKNSYVNESEKIAYVSVKRNAGAGDVVGIKFILSNSTSSYIVEYTNESFHLNELEEQFFIINFTGKISNINKISIAPILKSSDNSKKTGPTKDTEKTGSLTGNTTAVRTGGGGGGAIYIPPTEPSSCSSDCVTIGQLQCSGNYLQNCTNSSGCLQWANLESCANGCNGGGCNANATTGYSIVVNASKEKWQINKQIFGSKTFWKPSTLFTANMDYLKQLNPQVWFWYLDQSPLYCRWDLQTKNCGEGSKVTDWGTNYVRTDEIINYSKQAGATLIIELLVPKKGFLVYNQTYCTDGTDNDGNGFTDANDPNCQSPHYYTSPQYYADYVEYVNANADSDCQTAPQGISCTTKVNNLNYTHTNASENWANLRAYRGNVTPYNITYWEVGVEPYWDGRWGYEYSADGKDNITGFLSEAEPVIDAIKAQDSSIKIGVGGRSYSNWWDIMLPVIGNKIDWLSVGHTYDIYGGGSLDTLWQVGAGVARFNSTNEKKYTEHETARTALETYLPSRADLIWTIDGEHNLYSNGLHPESRDMINALYVISYYGMTIDSAFNSGDSVYDMLPELFSANNATTNSPTGLPTPVYYAIKLWTDHLQDTLLNATVNSIDYTINGRREDQPAIYYNISYISAWTTKSADNNTLSILIINRKNESINIPINITGFSFSNVTNYYINASNYTDNNEFAQNITIQNTTLNINQGFFVYETPKISINFLVFEKS